MIEVFNELLRIKTFREAEAAKEVSRRRALLEFAANDLAKAGKELEAYRVWSARRERELYDAIIDQLVLLADLEDLKLEVLGMRDNERLLAQKLTEAEKALESARAALEQARQAHMAAFKGQQKFMEISKILIAELRQETARREDIELEEFRRPEPEPDDEEVEDGVEPD